MCSLTCLKRLWTQLWCQWVIWWQKTQWIQCMWKSSSVWCLVPSPCKKKWRICGMPRPKTSPIHPFLSKIFITNCQLGFQLVNIDSNFLEDLISTNQQEIWPLPFRYLFRRICFAKYYAPNRHPTQTRFRIVHFW